MVKQAAVCHREAFAEGGVGAGTGPALFREPPPARALYEGAAVGDGRNSACEKNRLITLDYVLMKGTQSNG